MLDFSVTFIITIVNIVILYFILKAVLFKPVTRFMAERARRVQDSIDQANQDKVKAQALLVQYEEKLQGAKDEAGLILAAARKDAGAEASRVIAEGKAASEALIANARRQIEAEQQAAQAAFRSEAAVLVMAAAARIVQRELTGDDNRRFAGKLLEELSLSGAAVKGSR